MFLRLYGVATAAGTHVGIPMVKAGSDDLAHAADWTPAAGDVKVSLDGAAQANIATLPAFTNGQWIYQFSSAELACKSLRVEVVDAATKAVKDNFFIVETYGDPNALHPYLDGSMLADGGSGFTTYDRQQSSLQVTSERSDTWVAKPAIAEGTLTAVTAPSGGTQTITLGTGAVSGTDYYAGSELLLTPGTPGGGQSRLILAQSGTTVTIKQFHATLQPDTTTQWEILVGNRSNNPPLLDVAVSTPVTVAAGGINLAAYATDTDGYTAKVFPVDDNVGGFDRWTVNWLKNGVPVTSGITVPTIQIVKTSDGTNLVAATTLTQVGATGFYKLDTASRMVSGAAYGVIVMATIGGGSRVWYQPIGVPS